VSAPHGPGAEPAAWRAWARAVEPALHAVEVEPVEGPEPADLWTELDELDFLAEQLGSVEVEVGRTLAGPDIWKLPRVPRSRTRFGLLFHACPACGAGGGVFVVPAAGGDVRVVHPDPDAPCTAADIRDALAEGRIAEPSEPLATPAADTAVVVGPGASDAPSHDAEEPAMPAHLTAVPDAPAGPREVVTHLLRRSGGELPHGELTRRAAAAGVADPDAVIGAMEASGHIATDAYGVCELVEVYERRWHADVASRRYALEVDRRARAEVDGAGDVPLPKPRTLADLLADGDEPVAYRVENVWPANGRVVFSAQFKAGKTTLVGNVIRSLVDGEPFLGRFAVTPVEGRVVLLDAEMTPSMLKRWLADQAMRNADRVVPVSLRGRTASFDIVRDDRRAEWAEWLREVGADVLVIDPLGPFLDALGINENTETGRWTGALDALKVEAGVSELFVAHHFGHTGERARGDSRLRGWPDVEWRLLVDQDEASGTPLPNGTRYFATVGRGDGDDVDHVALTFDPATRHLTMGERSRQQLAGERMLEKVIAAIREDPGIPKGKLRAAVGGNKDACDAAISLAERTGHITVDRTGNSHKHYPVEGDGGPHLANLATAWPGT
jgi:hypothetical protein